MLDKRLQLATSVAASRHAENKLDNLTVKDCADTLGMGNWGEYDHDRDGTRLYARFCLEFADALLVEIGEATQ